MAIQSVSDYLHEKAESLAQELMDFNLENFDFEVPKAMVERGKKVQADFIRFMADAINYDNNDKVAREFSEWNNAHRNPDGESMFDRISSLVKPYTESRLFLNEQISSICIQLGLSANDAVKIHNRINYIQDLRIADSILAFEEYKNKIHMKTRNEMMELSAPTVSIMNGVAILPLIGSIDYARAEHISNQVIPKMNEMGIERLIIDFSGIVTVNPEVAGYLFSIHKVLIMLGISVAITGMRPDLANSIVKQGIDFKKIKTYPEVKQALDAWGTMENPSS